MAAILAGLRDLTLGKTTDTGFTDLHTRKYHGQSSFDAAKLLTAEVTARVEGLYEAKAQLANISDSQGEEATLVFHTVKAELQRARETKVACEIAYRHFGNDATIYTQWDRITKAYDEAKAQAHAKLNAGWTTLPLTTAQQTIYDEVASGTMTSAIEVHKIVLSMLYYMPDTDERKENLLALRDRLTLHIGNTNPADLPHHELTRCPALSEKANLRRVDALTPFYENCDLEDELILARKNGGLFSTIAILTQLHLAGKLRYREDLDELTLFFTNNGDTTTADSYTTHYANKPLSFRPTE